VRTVDEDFDSLLGQRQRWLEEGEGDSIGIVTSAAVFVGKKFSYLFI